MVASTGGYFGLPFKGCRGVTQGYPMSTTLFKVVVVATIRHWVTVVGATKKGVEGLDLFI